MENYDYDRVLHAADELNLYKTVKVEANDGFAVIKSSPCISAVPPLSKNVFPKLLEVMDDAYEDFIREYENARMCGEERADAADEEADSEEFDTGCGGCYNSDSSACTCRTSSSSDIQLIVR